MESRFAKCPACQGVLPEGEGRRRCPYCGTEVEGASPDWRQRSPYDTSPHPGGGRWEERRAGGVPPPYGGNDVEEEEVRPPWEAGGGSALSNFVETWKAATFRPTEFFRRLPAEPIGPAFIFGWLASGIGMGGQFFWFSLQAIGEGESIGAMAAPFFFLMGIAVAALSVAWNAVVVHLGCLILGVAGRKFSGTFRAVSYAQGPQVFAAVPFIGVFASIWCLVIEVIAIREMQRTTSWRAFFAIFLPGFLLAMVILFFVVLIIAMVGAAFLA